MVGAKYETQGFDRGWRSVHLEFHWDIFTVQLCVRCQNWEPYGHNFHMPTPLIISWHLYWMTVIPVTHSLSLINTTYSASQGPEKGGKGKILSSKMKGSHCLHLWDCYAARKDKWNSLKFAEHVNNSGILLQSKFGKERTIWKLVRSCQPDAFGILDGGGGRRGWKMPLNKKAMVLNAFLRLVLVNLNLPWPFVWPV